MDLIKTEYLREYQKGYQTEYYIKYKDLIAEKNKIYYEIHKKEKIIFQKKEKLKKNENMNLIKVEKKLVTLFF
jgi:hypothetical protein